jgi:hypothetical protein
VTIRNDLPALEDFQIIDASVEFGAALARARKALGLTQRDLALAIGAVVSQPPPSGTDFIYRHRIV